MNYSIQSETSADKTDILALIDLCFGPDRKSRTVYQFRQNISAYEELCLCAHGENGELYGSLRFWPIQLPDGSVIPLFGPLAVQPKLQGKGIGKALVKAGHDLVKSHGYPAILIIGKPDYYQPFGYSEEVVRSLEMPGPVAPLTFMGLELEEGFLSQQSGSLSSAR